MLELLIYLNILVILLTSARFYIPLLVASLIAIIIVYTSKFKMLPI